MQKPGEDPKFKIKGNVREKKWALSRNDGSRFGMKKGKIHSKKLKDVDLQLNKLLLRKKSYRWKSWLNKMWWRSDGAQKC